MSKVAALIPAAGSGERLGQGPKALLPLGGRTLLEHSLAALAPIADELIVAVAPSMLPALPELPRCQVITGGASRQETVARLLAATDAELVLIHDAARPFLPRAVAQAVLAAAADSGAATAARAVADSLFDLQAARQLAREAVRAIQTPQGFRRELIVRAHTRARQEGYHATDDAELVRRLGHPVVLVEGSAWLLKITTPADYEIACALAGAWRDHA